jgi:hypothetical protein
MKSSNQLNQPVRHATAALCALVTLLVSNCPAPAQAQPPTPEPVILDVHLVTLSGAVDDGNTTLALVIKGDNFASSDEERSRATVQLRIGSEDVPNQIVSRDARTIVTQLKFVRVGTGMLMINVGDANAVQRAVGITHTCDTASGCTFEVQLTD